MEIEKLDYEPGYKLNITATITDQAIKFENRCMGEALSLWQIKKEDVLARIQEADKLKAENEKLRAELDEKEKYYDQMIDALAATDSAELEQMKTERDAAVEYLRGQCRYCKRNLVCISRKGPHSNCWKWRGIEEG